MLRITFGIVTGGYQDLSPVISSIVSQGIPEYEIVVVGNPSGSYPEARIIPFDESVKPGWITKKKNIITEEAHYEITVYTHDYITFDPGWYSGYTGMGDFDVCMNLIKNSDGSRYRDWVMFPSFLPSEHQARRDLLLPYEVSDLTRFQYISGAYWVGKTAFMKEYPMDERLSWGEGEDVEWSRRINNVSVIKMNDKASVSLMKYKDRVFSDCHQELINDLRRHL